MSQKLTKADKYPCIIIFIILHPLIPVGIIAILYNIKIHSALPSENCDAEEKAEIDQ